MSKISPADLCEDCPATGTVAQQQGILGPLLAVTVLHDQTCPWLRRVAGAADTALVPGPGGVVVHGRRSGK